MKDLESPSAAHGEETQQSSIDDIHQAQQHRCSMSLPEANNEENPEDKSTVKALLQTLTHNPFLGLPAGGTL